MGTVESFNGRRGRMVEKFIFAVQRGATGGRRNKRPRVTKTKLNRGSFRPNRGGLVMMIFPIT